MRKTLIAAVVSSLFSLPAPVMAQAAAPAAAPASPHTITGNLAIVSDYRFRGISQTFSKPAVQGGVDYAHSSGFYLGNWNSNISSGAGFPDGSLEMDFYGGYKASFGDIGLDLGAIYYYYPGSDGSGLGVRADGGSVNNKEIYIGASWKFLSAKYSYSVDDYFSLRGVNAAGASTGKSTKGSGYLDLGASYDLGDGWGINGHVGLLDAQDIHNGDYTDWKVGVTKDIAGWVLAAAYVDTNADGKCRGATSFQPYCFANSLSDAGGGALNAGRHTENAGDSTFVVSVSKFF